MKGFLLLCAALFLAGCASYGNYILYNFEKNTVMAANVGEDMIRVSHVKKDDRGGFVTSSFTSTLNYSGRQGSSLKILYREDYNGYPQPNYTQDLTYDLDHDSLLAFRRTKLRIVEATNNFIKFIVLDDPAYKYTSGDRYYSADDEPQTKPDTLRIGPDNN